MQRLHAPDFEAFVSDARRRPQLWRLLAGICVAALIYTLWTWAVIAVYGWALGRNLAATVGLGLTPGDVYVLLASVIGLALGVILSARFLHRRRPGSLFGPSTTVLRDFISTAAVVGAVEGVALVFWSMSHDMEPGLDLSVWLPLLPLSLLIILFQTGAEELAFRGYLQQQLAARFHSPFFWMLIPSLGFGAAHYSPHVTGGNLWLFVLGAACFGLAAADLTARTGSIGAAWGFHFANNTSALLVIGLKDMVPGLALFVTPFSLEDQRGGTTIALVTLALGAAWFMARLALRR